MIKYVLGGLGIVGVLGLVAFLLLRFGAAREAAGGAKERFKWEAATAEAERHIASLRASNERLGALAANRFIERIETIRPIELRSKETVVRYAQTTAGAAQCLSAERVRGISEDRAALFPTLAAPAAQGAGAVSSDPAFSGP